MTDSQPAQPEEKSSPLKQIRTFQGDVAEALGKQHESLFSIQQSEQLKRASGGSVFEAEEVNQRREFILLMAGSFLLIGLGLVGAWYGYKEFLRKTAPPVIVIPENRFIGIQSEMTFNVASSTRNKFFSDIVTNSAEIKSNELMQFVLRHGEGSSAALMNTAEFLRLIQIQAPSSLVRAFDPLFMLGTLGESRFLLIKLSSFENAFAGMLSWEKTLVTDLGPLFVTAPLLQNNGASATFKDLVLRNKDTRVIFAPTLVGTSTAPALLYSFFNNRMLIITDSVETLRILIDRLTQELLSR